MTSKPYYETQMTEERLLEILSNLFNEDVDQVSLALQIMSEDEAE